ncbi:MAG: ABC transporter permease [Lewinellaceae bacterium]|nr:ABC transporter permease [Phaeodactylibacter sp.]MCB9036262.1 ABC transporter permease [Lewinellaceae bacterium]
MLALKLAFKNIFGAGYRTLLNIGVLSFAFVVILFYNGVIEGWNQQARRDTIEWEIGQGQLWFPGYDPLDFFSYQDAHGPIPEGLTAEVAAGNLAPILVAQASAFPQGRMQGVLLKGISPGQTILKIPTALLEGQDGQIPALIGKRMARSFKMKEGDQLLLRWRDKNGAFDAREVTIAGVFDCNVPTIDGGQIWLPLERLREMLGMPGEATLLVAGEGFKPSGNTSWEFKDHDFLLADLNKIIQSKKGGSGIIYGLLLVIALLAIFDTQVLSVFRRQKEIGTYIALGMTRWQVVGIFTVEGASYSILAILLGALYGGPLLWYLAKVGWAMPSSSQDIGLSIADKIYPVYGVGLILTTVLLVVLSATIVSFLPARKIARLHPTDALKGKIQ